MGIPKPAPHVQMCCFWDRHPMTTHPIGCPIYYHPNKLSKVCYSDTTKEKFVIRQNISNTKTRSYITETDEHIIKNDYYEVDGLCCSFNCALSYMLHCHKDPKIHLLSKMYLDYFGETMKITPAPDWRLLEEYGGHFSIQEFRESFGKLQYIDQEYFIHKIPTIKLLGKVYEEQFIF